MTDYVLILAPSHLASIGEQVLAADVVVLAEFRTAKTGDSLDGACTNWAESYFRLMG